MLLQQREWEGIWNAVGRRKIAELRSSTEKCFAVLVIISGIAVERLEKANMVARLIFVKKSPIETDAFLALAIKHWITLTNFIWVKQRNKLLLPLTQAGEK